MAIPDTDEKILPAPDDKADVTVCLEMFDLPGCQRAVRPRI
jgi:hypothetical protein